MHTIIHVTESVKDRRVAKNWQFWPHVRARSLNAIPRLVKQWAMIIEALLVKDSDNERYIQLEASGPDSMLPSSLQSRLSLTFLQQRDDETRIMSSPQYLVTASTAAAATSGYRLPT